MSTVAEIKAAIAKLSPPEYCELMAELVSRPDDEWDQQMKADAESGNLDSLVQSARDAARNGTLVSL